MNPCCGEVFVGCGCCVAVVVVIGLVVLIFGKFVGVNPPVKIIVVEGCAVAEPACVVLYKKEKFLLT